jgi:hypothetical protein
LQCKAKVALIEENRSCWNSIASHPYDAVSLKPMAFAIATMKFMIAGQRRSASIGVLMRHMMIGASRVITRPLREANP